jgi:hypothetical protein
MSGGGQGGSWCFQAPRQYALEHELQDIFESVSGGQRIHAQMSTLTVEYGPTHCATNAALVKLPYRFNSDTKISHVADMEPNLEHIAQVSGGLRGGVGKRTQPHVHMQGYDRYAQPVA